MGQTRITEALSLAMVVTRVILVVMVIMMNPSAASMCGCNQHRQKQQQDDYSFLYHLFALHLFFLIMIIAYLRSLEKHFFL